MAHINAEQSNTGVASNLKIQILLSTHNGEKYIDRQLNSILQQSYRSWELIISDDASEDNTVTILRKYTRSDPRVKLISTKKKGGAKENFLYLLQQADADIVFLCDQDDIWHSRKLETQVNHLTLVGQYEPCAISSDAFLIDDNDKQISKSFFTHSGLPNYPVKANKQLVENNMLGCTVAFNRPLLKLVRSSLHEAQSAIMHDWWIALLAANYGTTLILKEKLVSYRQHERNVVGASPYGIRSISKMLGKSHASTLAIVNQAKALEKFTAKNNVTSQHRSVEDFLSIMSRGKIRRIIGLICGGYVKTGLIRSAGQMLVFARFQNNGSSL